MFSQISKGCKENKRCLAVANSFSGGIFLAMGLVHIYPDVRNHSCLECRSFWTKSRRHCLTLPIPSDSVLTRVGSSECSYFLIFAFEKLICPNTHELAHLHVNEDDHHAQSVLPNGKENGHKVSDSITKLNDHKEPSTEDLKTQTKDHDYDINTSNCC